MKDLPQRNKDAAQRLVRLEEANPTVVHDPSLSSSKHRLAALNNEASALFQAGDVKAALGKYLQCEVQLKSSARPEFLQQLGPNLLEDIAECWRALGHPGKALEWFECSLKLHSKYGPDDRGFCIIRKMFDVVQVLPNVQSNFRWLASVAEKYHRGFAQHVPSNDLRFAWFRYLRCYLLLKLGDLPAADQVDLTVLTDDQRQHLASIRTSVAQQKASKA